MEFDKSRVFTALNADELKVGSKIICADDIHKLKDRVELEEDITTLYEVHTDDYMCRFQTKDKADYILAYLVEPPEEKKLKVSDLKLGDIVRQKSGNTEYLILGIDHSVNAVFFDNDWYVDKELENWEKVED